MAQLAIHGTDDATIAYDGGPKFGSPVFIMYSEPDSDKAWALHNGCDVRNLTTRNASAVFSNKHVHNISGVAAHHVYGDCPPDAPVEWFQTYMYGAGHVGTTAAAVSSSSKINLATGAFAIDGD